MTKLSELNVKEINRKGIWNDQDPEITGVETNSLKVEKGDIFLARASKTKESHGVMFSDQAIERGASLVITDPEGYQFVLDKDLNPTAPFLIVGDLEHTLNYFCDVFYPVKPNFIMGVTGTNGKTSVVNFSQQLIEQKNKSCVTIGTLGVGGVVSLKTDNTTPDQSYIAKILQMAKSKGADYALLEVSSHSLVQQRIYGVPFKVFCFTNLSQDHLDYHKNMEKYFQAKLSILDILTLDTKIIVNIDTEYGKIFFAKAKNKGFKIETIGFSDVADVKLRISQGTPNTQLIEIMKGALIYKFQTHLIGAFQALNIGMSLLVCEKFGFKIQEMMDYCSSLKPVPGRLEFVGKTKKGALVYIDFAHTPDALKHLLESLRVLTKGRLLLVFGAGGERDKDKRKSMGSIAYKYSDLIYVTDDNPRHEDAKSIRKQIIESCPSALEIEDRAAAITIAIQQAQLDDVVIIAGKGHEQVQIVRDNYFPFSDFEQASIAIELME
tara:strand:+ start:3668 stop:5149 length:1482 start_codon:yes stop_codon:yes gene_type:complete